MTDLPDPAESQCYLWVVADDGPQLGTIKGFADMWVRNEYSGDNWMPEHVLTWDGKEPPAVLPVTRRYTGTDEDDRRYYEFTVEGDEPVTVWLDGRA